MILGAGPAGLTAAYALTQQHIPVTVVERDRVVGGLARTEFFRGYGFDIGGHRFYTKMPEVDALWHQLLTHDFMRVPRLSRIHYRGKFFHYPLRLGNVLQSLGMVESARIFFSYLRARFNPRLPEENFEAYVINRFGERLYQLFFKSYTEKVWGIPTTEIRAEWAAQRIRGLTFTSVVKNALSRNGNTKLKSLIEEFEYPTRGPGMMWEAFANEIVAGGGAILLDTPVRCIERTETHIHHIGIEHQHTRRELSGSHFISSLALRDLIAMLEPIPPADVVRAGAQLHYRDFITVVLIVNQPQLFPDNWLYIHTPSVHVGRIQNYKNWSADMVPDANTTALGMEYFANEGDALWQMADEELIALAKGEVEVVGIARAADVMAGTVKRMQKAYPVYDATYRENLGIVRGYLDALENFQTIGRNGMHRYNNQDHSMMTGLLATRNLLGEFHDLWAVNTDMEYQEEIYVANGTKPK